MIKKIFCLFLCLQVIACSTLVSIRSQPADAKVYINGKYKGKSPLTVKLSNIAWQTYELQLKKKAMNLWSRSLKKERKPGPS